MLHSLVEFNLRSKTHTNAWQAHSKIVRFMRKMAKWQLISFFEAWHMPNRDFRSQVVLVQFGFILLRKRARRNNPEIADH